MTEWKCFLARKGVKRPQSTCYKHIISRGRVYQLCRSGLEITLTISLQEHRAVAHFLMHGPHNPRDYTADLDFGLLVIYSSSRKLQQFFWSYCQPLGSLLNQIPPELPSIGGKWATNVTIVLFISLVISITDIRGRFWWFFSWNVLTQPVGMMILNV